jgi:hypothetical protein
MKFLDTYKLYESNTITKNELVDKIKWFSTYIETYMNDYNRLTTSKLSFNFTYGGLEIVEIFYFVNNILKYDTHDGLITGIVNEFIKWGYWYGGSDMEDFGFIRKKYYEADIFDWNYLNLNDDDKLEYIENTEKFYIYYVIGKQLKNLINGTIWNIPSYIKIFNEEDYEFLYFQFIEEDIELTSISNIKSLLKKEANGSSIKISNIYGKSISINNISFLQSLNSYFKCAFLRKQSIYLPFYTI